MLSVAHTDTHTGTLTHTHTEMPGFSAVSVNTPFSRVDVPSMSAAVVGLIFVVALTEPNDALALPLPPLLLLLALLLFLLQLHRCGSP